MRTLTIVIASALLAAACSDDPKPIPPVYSQLIADQALAKQSCEDVFAEGAPAPTAEQTEANVPCKLPDGTVQFNAIASLDDPCEVDWVHDSSWNYDAYWRPGTGTVHHGEITAVGAMDKACAEP